MCLQAKLTLFLNNKRTSRYYRVFIHCSAGVSRAAMIAIAYVMYSEQMKLLDAYTYVKNKRHIIDPNSTFLFHLALLELQTLGCTSVHKHPKWRFNEYDQLKKGGHEEWEDDVPRKGTKGLFSVQVSESRHKSEGMHYYYYCETMSFLVAIKLGRGRYSTAVTMRYFRATKNVAVLSCERKTCQTPRCEKHCPNFADNWGATQTLSN